MKNVVYGFFLIMIFVLVIVFTVTITQRNSRENELQTTLDDSLEKAVSNVNYSQDYMAYSDEEYVAAVIEYMMKDIKTNAKNIDTNTIKLYVEVADADKEKGLLAINVVEEFTQLDGTTGHLESQQVVVLDKEYNRVNYTVKILTPDKNIWKTFSVKAGDKMPEVTELPTGFTNYSDLDGNVVELDEYVNSDLTYIANREAVKCIYLDNTGEVYTTATIYAGDEIPVPTSPDGSSWKNVSTGATLTAGTKCNSGDGVLNYSSSSTRAWSVVYINADGTKRTYSIVDGQYPVIPTNTTVTTTVNNGSQTITSKRAVWYYADADGNPTDVVLDGSKPITADTYIKEVILDSNTVEAATDYNTPDKSKYILRNY